MQTTEKIRKTYGGSLECVGRDFHTCPNLTSDFIVRYVCVSLQVTASLFSFLEAFNSHSSSSDFRISTFVSFDRSTIKEHFV